MIGKTNTFKIAVLGEGSVGKTTISKKYSNENSNLNQITMTKGVDIAVKKIIYDKKPVSLQIWDFAGQQQFRFMIDIFLKGIKGIIYVYDVNDIETLYVLREFVELTRKYLKQNNSENIPEILIGNKIDLNNSEVTINDIYEFMSTFNIEKHFLVSGMYGYNLTQPFEYLVSKIVKRDATTKLIEYSYT